MIWRSWLHGNKQFALADGLETTALGGIETLPAPVGERNLYRLVPRGSGLCLAGDRDALYRQIGAVLATDGRPIVYGGGSTGCMGAMADAALAAGADALGLNLVPGTPRALSLEEAAGLAGLARSAGDMPKWAASSTTKIL